VQTKKFSI
jgi:hypothetical protein